MITGTGVRPRSLRRLAGTMLLPGLLAVGWHATAHSETIRYTDVTSSSGIAFRHVTGGTGKRYFVETMGAGCAFLDFNRDGRLDLFAVNGGVLPGYGGGRPANGLYRNDGPVGTGPDRVTRFTDATARAGVGFTSYGMGCCAGDYDNDGFEDLYVACYGPNSLFHNNGDETFSEVGRSAGVAGDSTWSVGCAFLDYDNDGYLDLFVGNYVDYALTPAQGGLRPYGDLSPVDTRGGDAFFPHPDNFRGCSNRLYHNRGDGTFEDVTRVAGVYNPAGKAMGLVCGDYDGDGLQDVFVANDLTPDFLYHNEGNGTFRDLGLLSGAGYGGDGNTMSSMGADFGDYDGDGLPDLVVTHFAAEGVALYRNEGGGIFSDVSLLSGVKQVSLPYVHWGVGFVDYDNDGSADLIISDGHIHDNASRVGQMHLQPGILLHNAGGGRFTDVTEEAGGDLARPRVGRGASFGDFDDDGDVDAFLSVNNGPGELIRNEGGNRNGHWITVRLEGGMGTEKATKGRLPGGAAKEEPDRGPRGWPDRPPTRHLSNRDGIGARVIVWASGRSQVKEVRSGSGYLSQNDLRLHFGLGAVSAVDSLIVRWPSGIPGRMGKVSADREVLIREGGAKR